MPLNEEVNDMWIASVVMPACTNLRIMARQGKLCSEDARKMLRVPISFSDLVDILLRNKQDLIEAFKDDFGVPFHIETLERARSTIEENLDADILVFGDEKNESELVFGIAVNGGKKRITLAFRGSVTSSDYNADFNVMFSTIPDPSDKQGRRRIHVHGGIYSYLHSTKPGDDQTRWDAIVGHISRLWQEHSDYELYITGHSLGGTLAMFAGFSLGWSDDCKMGPVSVIAFGPMLAGDLRFRRAFQQLEKHKAIRCLCVVNEGDFIPLIPERGYPFTVYRRVGVHLKVSRDKGMAFSYAHHSSTFVGAWFRDIPNQISHRIRLIETLCFQKNFAAKHNVHEYTESIQSCTKALEKVDWDVFQAGRAAGGFIYDVW